MKNWPIYWTSRAELNLLDAVEYIAAHDRAAALRVAGAIRAQVEALSATPALGRPGRVPNTRELVIGGTPYLVIYRVRQNTVQVLRVLHTSRR
jgi:toxin ParE1/3/4